VADAEGVCAEGTRLCVAGWLTCEPTAASAEVCDGLDNDCDGAEDNGTPESLGEGEPCTSSCGEGELACRDGALVCVTPDGACDAGPVEDAGPRRDAAPRLLEPTGMVGSCACRAASPSPGAGLLALVAVLVGIRARLRRR
jgi:MYXO-CTERM domain-containing protein